MMIGFNIKYGNDKTKNWEQITTVDLISFSELYPKENIESGDFGINDFEFSLPNGERFKLDATYTTSNTGVMVIIRSNETVLLNIACWLMNDCNILFNTPKGKDVNISFGKKS